MILEDDEAKEITKVHRYFGHRNGRKTWELFAKAGKLRNKKKAVLELLDDCRTCKELKKTPPRPRVGMPVANSFNEVVGLDLKVLGDSKYILWIVDMFTKAIKGVYIEDKNPETIVDAITKSWILGTGFGPGHPIKGFYSNNGVEFLNNEVIDYAATLDTNIKMTAANAPWMNGVVERHHATADVIYEKLRLDNPGMLPQEAINHACLAKNSEVNRSGFSALQLVMGQNPTFPGLAEVTPASCNLDSSSRAMKALKNIDEARVIFREMDCNERLKKVRSQRINPSVEKHYEMGDPVFFRDSKKKQWKQGTALVRFGKTLYLKYGNWLRRVPIDTVIPDSVEAEHVEDGFVEPVQEAEEDRFEKEDVPVEELTEDLETTEENLQLKEKVLLLEEKIRKQTDNVEVIEDKSCEKEEPKSEEGTKQKKRLERRQRQKMKKQEQKVNYPSLGQDIAFKEYESEDWTKAKVFRVFKKSSIYKNVKQMVLNDGSKIEKNFDTEVESWKTLEEFEDTVSDQDVTETYLLSSILGTESEEIQEVYPVNLVDKKDYNTSDVQEAMKKEIEKYKSFGAYEEVDNVGQKSIPIRWVISKQPDDGKNQPIKARLCMRGDLEKDKNTVRSDSPTAGKDTMKLALMIAANEGFKVRAVDIKSAYHQGKDLERNIFVRPPPEAFSNKLWLLKKAAYGVLDGGRLFYLRLEEELNKLGLHKVHADGALFTFVKKGVFHGFVLSHVDDLLMAGDEVFGREVEDELAKVFKFSKIEENNFKYCGCTINVDEKGDIKLDQNEYLEKLQDLDLEAADTDQLLNVKEQKQLRGKIGEVLWLSLMTRPDLAFDVNRIASEVPRATFKTIKDMNMIVRRAKSKTEVLTFTRLGDISELVVKLYTDASYNNQDNQVRSTEGKVVLVENPKTGAVCVVSWKTKKIPRVCRSVKSAETRALEDGLDDAIHSARILKEVYGGKIDLKNPDQVPVVAKTDSKSLWENLHNTRQCEEKLLRNTIASVKEFMSLGLVSSVDWVSTDNQLADCLTKKGTLKKADWLLSVARTNRLDKN